MILPLESTAAAETIGTLTHQAVVFGLKVLAALAIFVLGAWLIKRIRNLAARVMAKKDTDPVLTSFLNSFIGIALWVLLIVLTISALGVDTTSLAALLAAGGMALGMALSGTVQNFAGGVMLLVFKPFRSGDFIEAQGFSGIVKEINIVSTKLVTRDNRVIILPNGALFSGTINNLSSLPLRRVDLKFSVCYGSPSDKVKETVLEIIRQNPIFLNAETPGAEDPFVALSALGESGVEFVVRAWVHNPRYWEAWFYLNETLYKVLPENGITFPFPQLDVHIRS